MEQSIWLPNEWLLPHRGSELLMVASTKRLAVPTPALLERLPAVVAGQVTRLKPTLKKQRHVPEKQQVHDGEESKAPEKGGNQERT